MKAIYFEDCQCHCDDCCLKIVCPREGKCACDKYREEHNPDCEGDYYFIDGGEGYYTIEGEEGGSR